MSERDSCFLHGDHVDEQCPKCDTKPREMPNPSEQLDQSMKMTTDLVALAWRYVWRHHGRGLSTSVGVHTRRLIAKAYATGYRAGRREKHV
jgi:hypothetical protein